MKMICDCTTRRIGQCVLLVVLSFALAVLIVFSVMNNEDLRKLNRHHAGKISMTNESEMWFEKRVNQTELSLKSYVHDLVQASTVLLREQLSGKQNGLNLNKSLLGLNEDMESFVSTMGNLTMVNNSSASEYAINRLHKVLNQTKTDLINILNILSQQNIFTLQSKIQDATNKLYSAVDKKLAKLRNDSVTEMDRFRSVVKNVLENKQEDDRKYFDEREKVINRNLSLAKVEFVERLDRMTSGLERKISNNRENLDQLLLESRKNESLKLWNKLIKLDARIKQLENNAYWNSISNAYTVLISVSMALLVSQYMS